MTPPGPNNMKYNISTKYYCIKFHLVQRRLQSQSQEQFEYVQRLLPNEYTLLIY